MTWLLVAAGAALGAPARYLTDRWIQSRHDSVFPWGTLLVNVVACAILGLLTGLAPTVDPRLGLALGTGFCGAMSTYSTFSYETLRLIETRSELLAVTNVVVSLVAGVGAMALGWAVGAGLA